MRLASTAAFLALPFVTVLVLAGCGGEPRKVGDVYVEGSVSSYNYYAEYREVRPSGKDKVFLFADPVTVAAFAAGAKELPLSKTMIGAGPNKETIVIEQVKDAELSDTLRKRLVARFMARAAAAPAPAAPAAPAPAAK